MNLGIIINIMGKLLAAMVLGFFLKKKGMLRRESDGSLSGLIVNVTLPALILSSVSHSSSGEGESVMLYFLAGVALYLLLPLVSKILVLPLGVEREKRGVYEMMLTFANVTFMAIPILQGIYGDSAVFYSSLLHMTFNLFIFTYGVSLLSKEKKRMDVKSLLNPGSLSCLVAIAIYFCHVPIPEVVAGSLEFVGNVTMPLSMIVLGSMLADYRFAEIATDKRTYVLAFLKLILMPAIAFLVVRPLWGGTMFAGMLILSVAMPSGSLCVMLANQYDNHVREASAGVLITTLFSIITIPVWMLIVMNT